MKFRATIEQHGKTATGLRVPPEIVEALGGGKRPAVRATINGYSYRTSIGSMGGVSMLPLAAEHRQAAGVQAGDEVEIELELDNEPREVSVPDDLQAALDQDLNAQRIFSRLSYSHKRQHVLAVETAKTEETRRRRVSGVLRKLTDA